VLDLENNELESSASGRMKQLATNIKDNGNFIAVIALNDGGKSEQAKINLLKNIANDDLFYEVTSASGLLEKFDELHSKLFLSYKKKLNSEGEDTFVVPPFGEPVFTFTFLTNSSEDNFELISPDERIFSNDNIDQLGEVNYMGYTTIVTAKNPAYGTWKSNVHARGAITNVSSIGGWLWNSLNWFFKPMVSYFAIAILSAIIGVLFDKNLERIIPEKIRPANALMLLFLFLLIGFILSEYVFKTI